MVVGHCCKRNPCGTSWMPYDNYNMFEYSTNWCPATNSCSLCRVLRDRNPTAGNIQSQRVEHHQLFVRCDAVNDNLFVGQFSRHRKVKPTQPTINRTPCSLRNTTTLTRSMHEHQTDRWTVQVDYKHPQHADTSLDAVRINNNSLLHSAASQRACVQVATIQTHPIMPTSRLQPRIARQTSSAQAAH